MTRVRLMAAALLLLAAPVLAQGPPPGGTMGGPPPEFRQMMAQMQYRRQLRAQIRAIDEMNRDPATALSPAQAKQLLGIVKPWTTRPRMTEADAQSIIRSIRKLLTPRQATLVANARPRRGFGGPVGPGGPGGPPPGFRGEGRRGGPEGRPGFRPGGPPPGFDPARMAARLKAENFLSTKAEPENPFSARRAEENKAMLAMLEACAHGSRTVRR